MESLCCEGAEILGKDGDGDGVSVFFGSSWSSLNIDTLVESVRKLSTDDAGRGGVDAGGGGWKTGRSDGCRGIVWGRYGYRGSWRGFVGTWI